MAVRVMETDDIVLIENGSPTAIAEDPKHFGRNLEVAYRIPEPFRGAEHKSPCDFALPGNFDLDGFVHTGVNQSMYRDPNRTTVPTLQLRQMNMKDGPMEATEQYGPSRTNICVPLEFADNGSGTEGSGPPSVPLPPPPPPPPPPPQGSAPFSGFQNTANPLPPPPPPPPPAVARVAVMPRYGLEDEVSTPNSFLPAVYPGESVIDISSRMIRIEPFRRNILVTRHQAHVADFEEYKWILKYGSPEHWYERPSKTCLLNLGYHVSPRCPTEPLDSLLNARPVSLENPRVWSSSALTTPTDNDIYDCALGHAINDEYSGVCGQCTDEKSEALENTPLVYYLVLSTCQASDPFIHGAHFNGKQIFKLVKCGSREAAAAECFYAAGFNGWNVAFSCVMRLGEDFEEKYGDVEKVDDLWRLAEETTDEDVIRAFY